MIEEMAKIKWLDKSYLGSGSLCGRKPSVRAANAVQSFMTHVSAGQDPRYVGPVDPTGDAAKQQVAAPNNEPYDARSDTW